MSCIEHAGYLMPNGYGQVRREGKTWLAHRWAAYVAHGPCPAGQVVRHTCDNRKCVNPAHLEYGTQGDNLNDRKERATTYRKLGKEDIPKIRQRLTEGATLAQVGREFGVSYVMIRYIRDGKQWAEY